MTLGALKGESSYSQGVTWPMPTFKEKLLLPGSLFEGVFGVVIQVSLL